MKNMRVKMLTREQELACFAAFRAGDASARDRVIEGVMPMAKMKAAKWGRGRPIDDLEQAAYVGLCIAFEKYEPATGNRFSTYAMWWVKAELLKANFSERQLGFGRNETYRKILVEIRKSGTRDPRVLALAVGCREDTAQTVVDSLSFHFGNDMDLEQLESTSRADELITAAWSRSSLRWLLARLEPRERFVIERRVLHDPPQTLEEVGALLSVSRERIRQIQEAAFDKLRRALKRKERKERV